MKAAENKKTVTKKANEEVWKDCTGFLPDDFEHLIVSLRTDSTSRFKRLGLVS